MTTLYVGNLPFSATEAEIRGLFEQHGQVDSVTIINDRETGRPRGFCFVDMPADAAQKAMAGLNGQPMNGRPLRVNEARERPPRAPRSGPCASTRRASVRRAAPLRGKVRAGEHRKHVLLPEIPFTDMSLC